MKLTDFNGDNKGATIYVELYLSVHNFFFSVTRYDWTNLMATFLLVSCSNKSSTSIVVVHGQGRKNDNKSIEQRHLSGFITTALY